jgi:predicted dehydrogenase
MNMPQNNATDLTRRDFIGSVATLMTLLGATELRAAAPRNAEGKELTGPKVKCAVIGLGPRGRLIIESLQLVPEAEIVALCDTYEPMLRRSASNVPGAITSPDYKTILDNKDIKAVFIATATHQHREVAVAALQAGKHVYCEAPLANTIEDAKIIAAAARNAVGQVFQPGLYLRSDPQRHFLLPFYRSGAIGRAVMGRAQWHKKHSWRVTSPNAEREKTLNWRLSKSTSLGLVGEVGIHTMDSFGWFLKEQPVAVTGWGGVLQWNDGRDVPDTIQAIFEYSNGVQVIYDATLANSFDSDYEMFYGTDAAIMLRANRAWLFKEVDSPLLGWEVYARKDMFGKETGIALVAGASKSTGQDEAAAAEPPSAGTTLGYALDAFLTNVNDVSSAVTDFIESYGNNKKEMEKVLAALPRQHAATWREGLDATIVAIKANEAINHRTRVKFEKGWFDLA